MTNLLMTQLKKAGFSGTDATVYISLLGFERAKAADIIRSTKLHRNLVYQSLERLEKRHLVSKVMQKTAAVFILNNPERLLDEHAEQGRFLNSLIDDLRPQQLSADHEVVIYEGIEGIARSTENALQQAGAGPIYALGGTNLTETSGLIQYWQKYHEERARKKIWMYLLFSPSTKKQILEHRNQFEFTEARYLPEGLEAPAWFHVAGDVVISEVPSAKNPLSIFVKSAEMATTMRMYFEFFWKQSAAIKK